MAGHVDISTGVYVGTARAYVAGLQTGTGTVDLISSFVQVRHEPGRRPPVTYRISVAGDPVAAGTAVPAEELPGDVAQVQLADGLTLMGARVVPVPDGAQLDAPFLELQAGAHHVRLAVVTFRGRNPCLTSPDVHRFGADATSDRRESRSFGPQLPTARGRRFTGTSRGEGVR